MTAPLELFDVVVAGEVMMLDVGTSTRRHSAANPLTPE
jgi:hypothetical protein